MIKKFDTDIITMETVPGTDFSNSPSRTQQHFADESDINTIIKRYKVTGLLVDPYQKLNSTKPIYGDFTALEDYHITLDKITKLKQEFTQLSSTIRKRFNNDVGQLMEFLTDPANQKEAQELGLIETPNAAEYKNEAGEPITKTDDPAKGAESNAPPEPEVKT